MKKKIFDQGDLIWVTFDPTEGHEERGRRPALVVSISDAQRLGGLIWVLPITTTEKYRTLSVDIQQSEVHGKVLVNQVRAIDPTVDERKVEYIGRCNQQVFGKVHEVVEQILNP